MKSAIPYIIIAILAAAVCFLLMRGCNSTPSHQQDKAAVDSVAAADSAYHKALQSEIDRLTGDSATQQDVIDNLGRENAWYEVQLSNTGQAITGTLNRFDSATARRDTGAIVNSCDTLASQVKAAKVEVHGFRLVTDSLETALVGQGRIKDSISLTWKSAFLHADTAESFLTSKYNSLYTDYTKQRKSNSITTKVLGGAVLVLLGALLIKK